MKKHLKYMVFLVTAIVIIVALIFFFYKGGSQKKEPERSDINIAWIGPLTGPYRLFGVDSYNAVRLAVRQYNQTKVASLPTIHLIAMDDKYNVKLTQDAYHEIVDFYHPLAIFVSNYESVIQLSLLAKKDHVLFIDPLDNDDVLAQLNQNVFVIAKKLEFSAAIMANAILAQGHKNIVIIYFNGDLFLQRIAHTVKSIFENVGGKAHLLAYAKSDSHDFRALLKEGVRDKADAYFIFVGESTPDVLKQAKALHINAPFYTDSGVSRAIMGVKEAEGMQFLYFTRLDGDLEKADKFLQQYQKSYRKKPILEWVAFQSYDAANIFLAAIKKASLDKQAWECFFDSVRDNVYSTTNYRGVMGSISMQLNGASRGMYFKLYRVTNGKIVPVPIDEKIKDNLCQ
jgi:branched-chain amino acid transport system substrate-binding protein